MTENEKSYAGLLYQPNDPELTSDRDKTVHKLYGYNHLNPLDHKAKEQVIRNILGKS